MHDDQPAISSQTPSGTPAGPPDWHARYSRGDTPWNQHSTAHALDRVIREWQIQPCRVLDMGCGTGREAIHLARLGFAVTAFDLVPQAITQAVERARQASLSVEFRVGDFRHLANLGVPFPFVFDTGFYHCVRRGLLGELLAFIERVTQPGSLWLTLTGNANDPQPPGQGPPRVRAVEICTELEPLFALVELRESHFQSTDPTNSRHPLAWSALLRRRLPTGHPGLRQPFCGTPGG